MFRLLQAGDLSLMHRWLNTPHVMEWWSKTGPTWEAVVAKYTPRLAGQHAPKAFVILCEDMAIGYIQTYKIREQPVYSACLQIAEEAAGVDLFIGEADYLHRGLGPQIMRRFVQAHVFVRHEMVSCVVDPDPTNAAAIRAYEKAGFCYLKTVQCPGEAEPHYLMRLARTDLGQG
jgi:RimJ/RimL family protein N-acetyltransferase